VDITSLTGITGSIQSQNSIQKSSDTLQAVIDSIVSGTQSGSDGDNVASVSIASQLQSSLSGLRSLSGNLALAGSLTQVADGGAQDIQSILGGLQSLAEQASSGAVSDSNRTDLNTQFQALAMEIDQVAGGTTFNGKSLLNGSLSGSNALSLDNLITGSDSSSDSSALSISDLTTNGLFGGSIPNILSASSSQQALSAINDALNQVTSNRAAIGSFEQSVNFASANVDTAVNNQQAAMSSLTDTDLAAASTQLAQATVQQNAGIALTAQGNQLLPSLLNLLD